MAIRVVIDIEDDGDVEAALKYLTEDSGRELKSFAQALERIYLEEYLPGKNDRMAPAAVHVHRHDDGPASCRKCDFINNYLLEDLTNDLADTFTVA